MMPFRIMSQYWVYILTNKPRATLYVGESSNPQWRDRYKEITR